MEKQYSKLSSWYTSLWKTDKPKQLAVSVNFRYWYHDDCERKRCCSLRLTTEYISEVWKYEKSFGTPLVY